MPTELIPGTVLGGLYELDALLGRGGMGSVWRARHLGLNSLVAVKVIEPAIARHAEALQRFEQEARASAALRSAHVVQTLDFGIHGEVAFIVMELLEGETLTVRLRRVGRLSPVETAELLEQVCRAVARAHDAGIVHRDLKPDNLFIASETGVELVKVLDFGVAKVGAPGSAGLTVSGALLGTPHYMSPEQAAGSSAVDHRSDLWALGVIAFECLLGHRPFQGDSVAELMRAIVSKPLPIPSSCGPVPDGFDAWFARACARAKALRFGQARELCESFRAMVRAASSRALEVTSPVPAADVLAETLVVPSRPPLDTLAVPTTASGLAASSTRAVPAQRGRRRAAAYVVGGSIFAVAVAAWAGRSLYRAHVERTGPRGGPTLSAATTPEPSRALSPEPVRALSPEPPALAVLPLSPATEGALSGPPARSSGPLAVSGAPARLPAPKPTPQKAGPDLGF